MCLFGWKERGSELDPLLPVPVPQYLYGCAFLPDLHISKNLRNSNKFDRW